MCVGREAPLTLRPRSLDPALAASWAWQDPSPRAGRGARIIPIDPRLPPDSRALDFSQSEALIAAGRAAALATLAHRLETRPATA